MIFVFSLLIYAATLLADAAAYSSTISRFRYKWLRYTLAALLLAADTVPFAMIYAVKLHLPLPGQTLVEMSMWGATIYFLITLPRIALYAGLFAVRRRPAGIWVGAAACTAVFAILTVSILKTRTDIEVRCVEAEFDNLPASFDGYRIVLFSDVHLGTMLHREAECRRLVGEVNALSPDLVLFGGDLIHIHPDEITAGVVRTLGGISATDGVAAVMGNHDTGIYIRDTAALPRAECRRRVTEAMQRMGWRMLADSTIYLHRGGDSVSVTGIDFADTLVLSRRRMPAGGDLTGGELDLSRSYRCKTDSSFDITVVHLPYLWHDILACGHGGDLVLAGHFHASQVKLSLGPLRFSPVQLLYREWSGMYRNGDEQRRLYITDGVGNVGFYMRIGARPEITSIELRSSQKKNLNSPPESFGMP